MTERTLREKLGQMVMCGFDGLEPTEGILRLIREYKLGGIIYFRRNIGSPEQVARLSAQLREAAGKESDVPLWIAVDQEGGMVARIDEGVALMPGNMTLGAARNPDYAYETAGVSGRELRQLGINLNFAPCLDVNYRAENPVIGVRSYGEDPDLVARLGDYAIRGYQDAGVSACAKHFPGHGDTAEDSHQSLPLVPHGRERLDEVELKPFRQAVKSDVDAIMTAHVRFPAYDDSGTPATLSQPILEGLLRNSLGYGGVIVTDCLEMKAISETVGIGKGAVMAVKAGADLVLVSHLLDRQLEALDALYEAVLAGDIPESRIDESVDRILAAKRKRLLAAGDGAAEDGSLGAEAHGAVARKVLEQGVTLLKNEAGTLPLVPEAATVVVWPEVRLGTEVDEVIPQEITLGRALEETGLTRVRELTIGTEPSEEEIRAVMEASVGAKQVVLGTYNASFSPGQRKLAEELLRLEGVRVTAVALRNPYDLLAMPDVHAYAACYENRPEMMRAVAKVLTGRLPARGKLPVTLSPEYPYGFGL